MVNKVTNPLVGTPDMVLLPPNLLKEFQRITDEEMTRPEVKPIYSIGDEVIVKYEIIHTSCEVWVGRIIDIKNRRYHLELLSALNLENSPFKQVLVPVRLQPFMQKVDNLEEALNSIRILYGPSRQDS